MSTRDPFDFSRAMRRLCHDISSRIDEFHHVRMDEVAVTFAQARRKVSHGLQARLTPMRFKNGSLETKRYGRLWTVKRLYHHDREILYILTFYLPRFLNHSFREKMVTVFHELYHISPLFNGDIRRMAGRCHVHTGSQKNFDRQMGVLVDRYLAQQPPRDVYAFLRKRFRTLQAQYDGVVGLQVPIPKLVPIPDKKAA